jgi:hypothetical protein
LLPNFEHKFSKQVGYVAWVSGQGVIDKFLSFILLLVVSEQVRDCHYCSLFKFYPSVFLCFPVPQSLSGNHSLPSRKSFEPCSGFLNLSLINGDFLILRRVIPTC